MAEDSLQSDVLGPGLLLLDSGSGGLSVLGEIRALLPGARIAYLADNARFPYGELADEVLVERLSRLIERLLQGFEPAAIVLACNTATTIAIAELRRRFTLPFVGVVPAIKPAAQLTKTGAVGLLATAATVRRPYTDRLIAEFAQGIEVRRLGSALLAPLAERKLAGHPLPVGAVAREVAPLFAPGEVPLDVVVLGCTHYPFLLPELKAAAPSGVTWLESGEAVARRVREVVAEGGAGTRERGRRLPADIAYLTGETPDWRALADCFGRFGLQRLELFRCD